MTMSKRQTRRSVSFKSEVFERARRHCSGAIPLAAWVEKVVTEALDDEGAPAVSRDEAVRVVLEQAEIAKAERAQAREQDLDAAMRAAFG